MLGSDGRPSASYSNPAPPSTKNGCLGSRRGAGFKKTGHATAPDKRRGAGCTGLVRRRLADGTSRPWLAGRSAESRARRYGCWISAVCCKTQSPASAREADVAGLQHAAVANMNSMKRYFGKYVNQQGIFLILSTSS